MNWFDIKAWIGIHLKEFGCRLLHGKDNHPWYEMSARYPEIIACSSCGKYKE